MPSSYLSCIIGGIALVIAIISIVVKIGLHLEKRKREFEDRVIRLEEKVSNLENSQVPKFLSSFPGQRIGKKERKKEINKAQRVDNKPFNQKLKGEQRYG